MNAQEGKALLDHGNTIARRYAGRVGPDVAEELRGEAVLRALRSPPPDGRMEPWLERIYRNLFVDRWRRGHVRTVDLAELPELAGRSGRASATCPARPDAPCSRATGASSTTAPPHRDSA
jgi:DNA-directed RNA polymerase specialized sigma24 family protein